MLPIYLLIQPGVGSSGLRNVPIRAESGAGVCFYVQSAVSPLVVTIDHTSVNQTILNNNMLG